MPEVFADRCAASSYLDPGNEASWTGEKIGLICRYSGAPKCADVQNYKRKHWISVKGSLEGALAEGVFGASEVEEADVSDCIRGQIAC